VWGEIVNNSRNLALKINAFVGDTKLKKEFVHLIINYNFVLKDHLRNKDRSSELYEMPLELSTKLDHATHKPNYVAKEIFVRINTLYKNKDIDDTQFLILNEELKSFTNAAGACERIRNTPIPYSYNLFLKKIIFFYVASIPFMFASDFGYGTILIAISMLYVFASIELIAEEIEDPFGEDDNDLPLDDICTRIKSNLIEIVK
jgi:putative membrane protein